MLTSTHHPILEEIGRLEAEREVITHKINQLRATLPLPEKKTPVGKKVEVRQPITQATPVVEMMSQPTELEPQIADHAVIRFLERRFDFDFDSLKRELLTDTMKLAIRIGAQSVKAHGGRFMIRGNKATTFIIDRRKQR